MKTKRQLYDTRNCFQKTADEKKARLACIVIAVGALGVAVCLIALSVTGRLRGGDPITTDDIVSQKEHQTFHGSLWHAPTSSPSTTPSVHHPTSSPIFLSATPSLIPSPKASDHPSSLPSFYFSEQPSPVLSKTPTIYPSTVPPSSATTLPSTSPTNNLSLSPTFLHTSSHPSTGPSSLPSPEPTVQPSAQPSVNPTSPPSLEQVTFEPGNLSVFSQKMWLSKGLKARLLATKNQPVSLLNGQKSSRRFHQRPDFGATFPTPEGGWVYVSNSEMKERGSGGVGAMRFDSEGNVLSYDMILTGSTMNCGGGKTPWNTWISCEEIIPGGQVYQVDPQGQRPPAVLTMGVDGGRWESFAYDVRDSRVPRYFVTEDHPRGPVRRFTPFHPDWSDPWTMLHGDGLLEFLVLDYASGTFSWTADLASGRNSAETYYPECEGIDVNDGILYVVSKRIKQMYILDLDSFTYTNTTTKSGLFDGAPDQIKRILGDTGDLLYFTEEGGKNQGVHARDGGSGRYLTILEGEYNDETTGLSFSPNGKFMYFAFQETGLLFEIRREDGFPFHGRSMTVRYHNDAGRRI